MLKRLLLASVLLLPMPANATEYYQCGTVEVMLRATSRYVYVQFVDEKVFDEDGNLKEMELDEIIRDVSGIVRGYEQ